MYGIEQVIAQAVAALQDDWPTRIPALNSEYGDAIMLAVPAATSYTTIFDKALATALFQQGGYPAVVIEPRPEQTVSGEPNLGDEYAIEHGLQVSVIVQVADWRIQQTMLMRYLRAMKETLGQQLALDCGQCRYDGGGFASQYTLPSRDVLRDIAALFTVTTYQQAT